MEVRQTIDDLRYSVEHITAENELWGIIVDRLTALRQVFTSQRRVFTPGDIEFLQSLTGVSDHLRAFAHRVKTHVAAIARLAGTTKRRARMYPLVRVNPDHAEFHIARKAQRTTHNEKMTLRVER